MVFRVPFIPKAGGLLSGTDSCCAKTSQGRSICGSTQALYAAAGPHCACMLSESLLLALLNSDSRRHIFFAVFRPSEVQGFACWHQHFRHVKLCGTAASYPSHCSQRWPSPKPLSRAQLLLALFPANSLLQQACQRSRWWQQSCLSTCRVAGM